MASITEEDETYEVERVVDHQVIDDQDHYLIKWKNYSDDHNTWEPV
jgi:chromobox protein 5